MAQNTKQIKVSMPNHLYAALWQEAKDSGVTMAALVRLAVKQRYALQKMLESQASYVLSEQQEVR